MRLLKGAPRFFTYSQVAEILNLPVCEVKELIAEGELRETRLLTKWRIAEIDLLKYIRKVTHEDS